MVRSIALCLLVLAAPAAAERHVVDRVVAIVNDAVILESELRGRMVPLEPTIAQIAEPAERERRRTKLTQQMLDEMIADELVVQAAREAKLTVEDSELQQTIDYIKQQNKLDDEQLAEAMRAQGITFDTLRKDLLRQRAVHVLVGAKVSVTDADMQARYAELQRRATNVSAVRISQILFALPDHPTEPQIAAAKARATQALDRLAAGEAFAKVATDMTDDATTRAGGGEIGWLTPSDLSPTWEPIVLGMAKGDVRGPLQGDRGLYVLYANEVQKTALQAFAEMKPKLKSELEQAQLAKFRQAWIEELRKKAYIDIKPR